MHVIMCMSSIVTYACVTCISVYLGYTVQSLAVACRCLSLAQAQCGVCRKNSRCRSSLDALQKLFCAKWRRDSVETASPRRAAPAERGLASRLSRGRSTRRALYPDHSRRVPPPARESPGCASLMPPRRRPVFSVSLAARASSVQRLARRTQRSTRARTAAQGGAGGGGVLA